MGLKANAAVLVLALSAAALSAGAASAAAIDPNMGGPGNAAHGEALFKQRCGVCHQADPGGKNGVGPLLYGAFGRRAGGAPGFTYSDNLKASGLVWNPQLLNQWIQKPSSLVPGTKMNIPPVSQPQDRADIIAYLRTRTTTPGVAAPPAKSPHERHEEHERQEHGAKHHTHPAKS